MGARWDGEKGVVGVVVGVIEWGKGEGIRERGMGGGGLGEGRARESSVEGKR